MAERGVGGISAGWFGRGRTRAVLSLGLLLGMPAVATSAFWADEEAFSGGPANAGVMHIDLASNERVKPETIAWTALDLADLPAGSSRSAVLSVSNNSRGDLRFSYRIQGTATGALGAVLHVEVYRGGMSDGTTCGGGNLVASGQLQVLDQPAGVQLGPGQLHNLCIEVTRQPGAVPAGATSDVTFTFPAKQEIS